MPLREGARYSCPLIMMEHGCWRGGVKEAERGNEPLECLRAAQARREGERWLDRETSSPPDLTPLVLLADLGSHKVRRCSGKPLAPQQVSALDLRGK